MPITKKSKKSSHVTCPRIWSPSIFLKLFFSGALQDIPPPSLPLDRPWRFARHIVDDAVDAAHLLDDAAGESPGATILVTQFVSQDRVAAEMYNCCQKLPAQSSGGISK